MRKLAAIGLVLAGYGAAWAQGPAVWSVDPLVKVFPDTEPASANEETPALDVARGEHASFQIAVRSPSAVRGLRARVSGLRAVGGGAESLRADAPRFVGYVPVERPMPTPASDVLRAVPAEFPDPLLEVETCDVPASRTQAVWITVPVPVDCRPGLYRGEVVLQGEAGEEHFRVAEPIAVQVHSVVVRRTRLWVTNWFNMCWWVAPGLDPDRWAPPGLEKGEYWKDLARHARLMSAYRQNTAIISPLHMCRFSAAADGTVAVDWTGFDRAVQVFIDAGVIGRIEGAHLGGRAGGWESQFVASIQRVKDGQVEAANLPPDDPAVEAFLADFLPKLTAHLEEKGWLDRYMQHIADEPIDGNLATYQAILNLVRKHGPRLRIIDAVHSKHLIGKIDVAVPMLNYLHAEYDAYREHPRDGRELWFYTCCQPQGEYANRFVELPLIKTRLLHWINYRYALTGYLHWGYNWYIDNKPFERLTATAPAEYWPAGDAYVVYPGPNGPLASIRLEAMRDGIVDHELLSMLAERDRAAADELCGRHILAFDKYETQVPAFRATRKSLLEKLSAPATAPVQ